MDKTLENRLRLVLNNYEDESNIKLSLKECLLYSLMEAIEKSIFYHEPFYSEPLKNDI